MKDIISDIDMYIETRLSTSDDAGWEGESVAARLITYKGDIPRATGLDQSNMAMERAIRLLRDVPERFHIVAHALQEISYEQYNAIIAKRLLQHINPETDKTYTDADRAYTIGQNLNQFKYNYKQGLVATAREIDKVERYEHLRGFSLRDRA